MAHEPKVDIDRTGTSIYKFTAAWKKDKGYDDGTEIQWKVDLSGQSDSWGKTKTLSKNATTDKYTIGDANDFYPVKSKYIVRIGARVRVKKGSSWSGWGEYYFNIEPPKKLTVTPDKDLFVAAGKTIFEARVNGDKHPGTGTSAKPFRPFYQIRCETKKFVGDDVNNKELSSLDWSSPSSNTTTKTEYKREIDTDTSTANTHFARVYRARAEGYGGAGPWNYAFHYFGDVAGATESKVDEDSVVIDPYSQTIAADVYWSFPTAESTRPDYMQIEYCIGVPRTGMTLPANPSWQVYDTYYFYATDKQYKKAETTGSRKVTLNQTLEKDNCCWFRVSGYKEGGSNASYGTPQLVAKAYLKSPTVTEFTTNPTTHRITVKVTNNSEVEDSFICVVYHDDIGSADDGLIIGIIPHGKSGQSMTFQAPDWEASGAGSIGVEAFAVAGASLSSTTRGDGVTIYELNRMTSQIQTTTFTSAFDNTKVIAQIELGDLWTSGNYNKIINKSFEVYYTDGSLVPASNYAVTAEPSDTFPWFTIIIDDTDPTRYSKAIFKYTLNSDTLGYMISERNADAETESVPRAPENVNAVLLDDNKTIQVTWDMTWQEADGSEVSWANHEDAWYSTARPNTFEVENIDEPKLNIADVEQGTKWFIRVRLYKVNNSGSKIYSSYAVANEGHGVPTIFAPNVPTLSLSKHVIPVTGQTTASWVYVTNDTTPQSQADIGEIVSGTPTGLVFVETAQHVVLRPSDLGWSNNSQHQIVVKVTSESGAESEWSDPVTLTIAPLPSCSITQFSPSYVDRVIDPTTYTGSTLSFSGGTSDNIKILSDLTTNIDYTGEVITGCTITLNGDNYDVDWSGVASNVYGGTFNLITGILSSNKDASGNTITPTVYSLGENPIDLNIGTNTASSDVGNLTAVVCNDTYRGYEVSEMPITYTVTGAGTVGVTNVTILRNQDYSIDTPTDNVYYGAEDEVVYNYTYEGESQQTITLDDLYQYLNDGCRYIFQATVCDQNGQVATDTRTFMVNWSHQAVIPEGQIDIEDGIARIIPRLPILPYGADPEDYADDFIDIYRLSADQPELIYHNAKTDQVYIDPYPTIGSEGGYRLVYRTLNGDYTTAGNVYAWQDIHVGLDTKFQLINYGSTVIEFKYNIKLKNSWDKKFTKTFYLGGSTQGDWDSGIDVKGNVDGNVFYDLEPETYEQLRDLGAYSGLCHLRTIDGTNIVCNINVSDSSQFNSLEHQHDISLTIERVDNPEFDGMTLADWENEE